MQVVTGFESDTPEQELAKNVEQKFDYSQVEGALKNDRTVAENVFARCAKHHFRKCIGESVRMLKAEDPAPSPQWFGSVSVTLFIDGPWGTQALADLVASLAETVTHLHEGKSLALIGPLETRISEVSPKHFNFSLKQRWGLNGE